MNMINIDIYKHKVLISKTFVGFDCYQKLTLESPGHRPITDDLPVSMTHPDQLSRGYVPTHNYLRHVTYPAETTCPGH